jgi:hypothetical protein
MASWATPAQAARHWPDSATLDPTRLTELLDAATSACRAYALEQTDLAAPVVDPSPIPTAWTIATVYQAREVYASAIRDGDLIGAGDVAYRSRPLTPTVLQLLRPQTRGGVG